MSAIRHPIMTTSHKGGTVGKVKTLNRHRRVTTEMVSAARAAVRKANEDARRARLRRIRNKR